MMKEKYLQEHIEKREIDRSTLYSFDGPFQLIHADVGNLNGTIPGYVFLFYVFKKQILQKPKLFFDETKIKEKIKR